MFYSVQIVGLYILFQIHKIKLIPRYFPESKPKTVPISSGGPDQATGAAKRPTARQMAVQRARELTAAMNDAKKQAMAEAIGSTASGKEKSEKRAKENVNAPKNGNFSASL